MWTSTRRTLHPATRSASSREFRNKTIAAHTTFRGPLDDTIYRNFEGQVLCSEDILDAYSKIVFFIHDMGNFRLERPGLGLKMNEEGMRLVDSRSSFWIMLSRTALASLT